MFNCIYLRKKWLVYFFSIQIEQIVTLCKEKWPFGLDNVENSLRIIIKYILEQYKFEIKQFEGNVMK